MTNVINLVVKYDAVGNPLSLCGGLHTSHSGVRQVVITSECEARSEILLI